MTPFGQTVFLWRVARGLTQEQLAKRARISRPNLSAIERGKREVSLGTLRALALNLEIRPGILVDGIAPGVREARPARRSREALERMAEAVVRRTRVHDPQERAVVEALRRILTHRTFASQGRWRRSRRGRRAAQTAWLQLESTYPREVVQSLIQRVIDRSFDAGQPANFALLDKVKQSGRGGPVLRMSPRRGEQRRSHGHARRAPQAVR